MTLSNGPMDCFLQSLMSVGQLQEAIHVLHMLLLLLLLVPLVLLLRPLSHPC